MIANPFPGQPVQLHYRAEMRPLMPFHGQRGIVVQCCHGRPRNHLVKVGHRHVVVPCGNLRVGRDSCEILEKLR